MERKGATENGIYQWRRYVSHATDNGNSRAAFTEVLRRLLDDFRKASAQIEQLEVSPEGRAMLVRCRGVSGHNWKKESRWENFLQHHLEEQGIDDHTVSDTIYRLAHLLRDRVNFLRKIVQVIEQRMVKLQRVERAERADGCPHLRREITELRSTLKEFHGKRRVNFTYLLTTKSSEEIEGIFQPLLL